MKVKIAFCQLSFYCAVMAEKFLLCGWRKSSRIPSQKTFSLCYVVVRASNNYFNLFSCFYRYFSWTVREHITCIVKVQQVYSCSLRPVFSKVSLQTFFLAILFHSSSPTIVGTFIFPQALRHYLSGYVGTAFFFRPSGGNANSRGGGISL